MLIIWGAVFADRFFFEQLAHVYLGPRACGGKFGRSGLEEGILQVAKVLRILAEGLDDLRRHYNSLECPPAARSTSSRLHFCASRNANKLRHLNLVLLLARIHVGTHSSPTFRATRKHILSSTNVDFRPFSQGSVSGYDDGDGFQRGLPSLS